MILPIYAYGQPILKKKAERIDENYPDLPQLIENMYETMYNASGVGLAAPQIGLGIRLFIMDTEQLDKKKEDTKGIKRAFINAEISDYTGGEWAYEEGCLSIPNVLGDVVRDREITIKYMDEHFQEHTETFNEINSRVIQHEYDHIEGVLFTEKLKPLKKRMIKRKLEAIRKGNVKADYRLKFPR